MTRALFILIVSIMVALPLSGQSLTVKKVAAPIAIDGIPDEPVWDISTELTAMYADNTAFMGVLWDNDYLYVAVKVTDDYLALKGRQGWYDDGVEICIDGNNDNNTNYLTEEERHFVKVIRSYWLQEATGNYDGITAEYAETDDGYSMEFAISWSNIGITPYANSVIGFNAGVNDVDEMSGQNTLTWTNNGIFWYPSSYGELVLSSETVSASESYIALVEPNGGDFLIKGQDQAVKWKANNVNSVNIEYSSDDGATWNMLVSGINAADEIYEFTDGLPASQTTRIKISGAANGAVSDISYNSFYVSDPLTPVEPNIKATWQNFQWPYNAYYPENNGNMSVNGHFANSCGPSSLSRIMHMWEFPRQGKDSTQWYMGGIGWFDANFGEAEYKYDQIPLQLPSNATEDEYAASAKLLYDAQASIEDTYNSGGDLDKMSYAMSHYFNYKESQPVYRNALTKAEWMQLMINELSAGRTLLINGMMREHYGNWHSNNGIKGHWWHVDGFNEKGEFHTVLGFGNYQYDGYYDADSLSQYLANQGILVGLEPDLDGKMLQLTSFDMQGQYVGGSAQTITWNSVSVDYLDIEYSTNNGWDWQTIAENVPAASGNYSWTLPETSSGQCKVRLTDSENINVYDKSGEAFSILTYSISLSSPLGGESMVAGDNMQITWENTLVEQVKIEYTVNGGAEWLTISSGVSGAEGSYLWTVPNVQSENCKVKISDALNGGVNSVSPEPFSIVLANYLGGPYKNDDNTVLLLHFENECSNSSGFSGDPLNPTGHEFQENSVDGLGKAVKLSSPLVIPDSDALDLTGDWTIEFWFKVESYNTVLQYFLQKPGDGDPYFCNYAVQMNPYWGHNLFSFYFSGENRIGVGGIKPQLNQWYHLAFIRDTQTSSIKYILRDAARNEVATMTQNYAPGTPAVSAKDLIIGQDFNGLIDEVRISNVVRSYTNNLAANFTASPLTGQAPLTVQFNDISSGNPSQFEWDFNNDGTVDSQEEDPEWVYDTPGTYSVSLKVTSGIFGNDVIVKQNLINVKKAPGIPVITAKIPQQSELNIRHIDRVNFSVTANDTTGYALNYSWQLNGTAVNNNGNGYSYKPDMSKPFPRTDTVKVIVSNGANQTENLWYVHTQIVAGTPEITACFPENPDTTLEVKDNIPFRVETVDSTELTLEYSWFVNGSFKDGTDSIFVYTADAYPELPRTDTIKVVVSNGTNETSMEWRVFIDKISGLSVEELPTEFSLGQNYPNPFNPTTKIRFTIPASESGRQIVYTSIKIYDMLGNEVASPVSGEMPSGYHEINFNASRLASGIYIYRITAGEFTFSRKMMLLK